MSSKKTVTAKVSEVKGMTCVVRKTELGVYVGYVGLEEGHPMFGCNIYECERLDVHGGVTYAGARLPWWHPDGKWWLGFDCAHCNDALPGLVEGGGTVWRDEEYAIGEVTRLAKQLFSMVVELN